MKRIYFTLPLLGLLSLPTLGISAASDDAYEARLVSSIKDLHVRAEQAEFLLDVTHPESKITSILVMAATTNLFNPDAASRIRLVTLAVHILKKERHPDDLSPDELLELCAHRLTPLKTPITSLPLDRKEALTDALWYNAATTEATCDYERAKETKPLQTAYTVAADDPAVRILTKNLRTISSKKECPNQEAAQALLSLLEGVAFPVTIMPR